jgi:hypothetical protein
VTLTVLSMICFLAGAFFLYILVQWMRDTKHNTTTRPRTDTEVGKTWEKKRPYIVGSGKAGERPDRLGQFAAGPGHNRAVAR